MAALDVTCSRRFKGWWLRCARHYGANALLPIQEGTRYGMLWYAYRTGWRHAREAQMKTMEDAYAAYRELTKKGRRNEPAPR